LADDADAAVDIVYGEFLLRHELGETPSQQEYIDRFPKFAVRLREQFSVFDALQTGEHPDPNQKASAAGVETSKPDASSAKDSAESPTSDPRDRRSLRSPPSLDDGGPDALQLPGFEILGEIARGGMGIVYRARDLAFQRDVAVKVLQDKYRTDAAITHRFLDEARITGQLQHPGIPAVHQVGKLADGRPYLTMKLIRGQTLDELLQKPKSEHPNWLAVFESICHAVGYAHSRNVIHRDLKPANIMVGGFGDVQVMDWGLAKVLAVQARDVSPNDDDPTSRQAADERASRANDIRTLRAADTRAGSVLGTVAYMPPEQAGGEIDLVDRRADAFSLGAILCTILTGTPPYIGNDFESVLRKAIRCKTEAARQRLDASGNDRALIGLAKRCLLEDPAQRPADANVLAAEVSRIRMKAEELARKSEIQRARRRVFAALLVVLVVGTTLSVFYAIRADRNAGIAQKNEDDAKKQTKLAENATATANTQTGLAKRAADDLATQLKESRRLHDLSLLRMASTHFTNNLVLVAHDTLDEIDLKNRCFGWRYLKRQIEGGLIVFRGHTGIVRSVSLSADGSRLATGSDDHTARLWDARTGQCLVEFRGHISNGIPQSVSCVSLSADGSRLVTGSVDTARLWDARTGMRLLEFKGHTGRVTSVCLSTDSSRLATGSWDNTARLWDTRTGQSLLVLKGHTHSVESVFLSADGSRLATGSADKTARLWDMRSGQSLIEFKGHIGPVISVSLSANGSRLATGSSSGGLARDCGTPALARACTNSKPVRALMCPCLLTVAGWPPPRC
jgi:serine/threonine protein kinase